MKKAFINLKILKDLFMYPGRFWKYIGDPIKPYNIKYTHSINGEKKINKIIAK